MVVVLEITPSLLLTALSDPVKGTLVLLRLKFKTLSMVFGAFVSLTMKVKGSDVALTVTVSDFLVPPVVLPRVME